MAEHIVGTKREADNINQGKEENFQKTVHKNMTKIMENNVLAKRARLAESEETFEKSQNEDQAENSAIIKDSTDESETDLSDDGINVIIDDADNETNKELQNEDQAESSAIIEDSTDESESDSSDDSSEWTNRVANNANRRKIKAPRYERSHITEDSSDETETDSSDDNNEETGRKTSSRYTQKDFQDYINDINLVGLRKFQHIPAFIVEFHHDVLEFILTSIGNRFLPIFGNTLLHFDSHPDMVIPRELSVEAAFNKTSLINECCIESWIMPLCFTGIITRIIWLKYSWCTQIPAGQYKFNIGSYKNSIYVDLAIPYFLSEGSVCHTSELLDKREIELIVIDAYSNVDESTLKTYLKYDEPYIFDIDLDFFSTNNPFLDLYSKFNYYKDLQDIFSLDIDDLNETNVTEVNERRLKKLNYLKNIFEYLSENAGDLENYKTKDDDDFGFLLPLMKNFVKKMLENYENDEIDWLGLYDGGCTCDSGGLPIHISTSTELDVAFKDFSKFISILPHKPIMITISRSSQDEYCPLDQVEHIQRTLLETLSSKFVPLKPIRAYIGEDYNIRKI